jgi:alpha-glucosidase (family GH31 glycosyl hydrolase)
VCHTEDCAVVRPYGQPVRYDAINRDTLQWRSRMTPYLYNAAFVRELSVCVARVRVCSRVCQRALMSGAGVVSPLYYEWPQCDEAYRADPQGNYSQYMFGPDMIAAPVVRAPGTDGLAHVKIWLPQVCRVSACECGDRVMRSLTGQVVRCGAR